jgi:hypothetical protein
MTRGWQRAAAAVAAIAVTITACGTKNYTAGIDRSGTPTVVKGPITGFGSIFINGVEYDTNAAVITFKENPGTEGDLAIGHIVTLRGTDNGDGTGRANEVEFEANAQGPVDSIDVAGGTLVVMGQIIVIDMDTSFGGFTPAGLDGISVGEVVEVSGFVGAASSIHATRIGTLPANSSFEAIGTISNINQAAQTFNIGVLNVDYSSASLEMFPSGTPANGDQVEVEGTMIMNGTLIAQEVEFRTGGLGGNDGEEGEIEGLITRFVDPADFDVDGVTCTTNRSTVYEGGTEVDLQLNVKIQVEGTFNSSGLLVASKVEVKDGGAVQFNAKIDAVSSREGVLIADGQSITVRPTTRLEDLSMANERYFNPSHLRVGDSVLVTMRLSGNQWVASSLVRLEND